MSAYDHLDPLDFAKHAQRRRRILLIERALVVSAVIALIFMGTVGSWGASLSQAVGRVTSQVPDGRTTR